jgi:hypothetical protein
VGTVVVPMTRMFKGTNTDIVNLTLHQNGMASFRDVWDVQAANVYRIGCAVDALKRAPALGELCGADCDFEESSLEAWRPLMSSAAWDKASGLGGEHVMLFNTTDDRTWLRTDTSDAFQGRYSGKLNVPTSDMPVLLKLPVPSTTINRTGIARVRLAV